MSLQHGSAPELFTATIAVGLTSTTALSLLYRSELCSQSFGPILVVFDQCIEKIITFLRPFRCLFLTVLQTRCRLWASCDGMSASFFTVNIMAASCRILPWSQKARHSNRLAWSRCALQFRRLLPRQRRVRPTATSSPFLSHEMRKPCGHNARGTGYCWPTLLSSASKSSFHLRTRFPSSDNM